MIKTIEELEALSKDTPIRDVLGFVWGSADEAAEYAEEYGVESVLPAVQLIPTTVSRERFEEAVCAYQKPRQHVNGSGDAVRANLTAALTALGIEVDDVSTTPAHEGRRL